MSLTRDEWIEMWDKADRLEQIIDALTPHATGSKTRAKKYIRFIKDKIQQVIGQME